LQQKIGHMGKEIDIPLGQQIPTREQRARTVLDGLVTYTPFFRSEIVNPERLEDARTMLRQGLGLCIVANHFSQREAIQIYQIPFGDPELRMRRVVAPLAKHQKLFFMDPLSHLLGVSVKYIVTAETVRRAVEKGKSVPKQNEGAIEFMEDALKILSQKGILILFPQGTRRETLYSPENPRTVGTLMLHAKKNEIRLGFLFVGVDLAKEVEDYSKVRGFNLFNMYKLTIGNSLTGNELLTQAGGKLGKVDEIVYKQLECLVSPRYAKVPLDLNLYNDTG